MKVVIVPAYNEEKNIKKLLEKLKEYDLKVLVVDDGSKDNTAKVAESLGADVLKHENNKGKAKAIENGIRYVLNKYKDVDFMIFMDSDLQHDPKDLKKFFKVWEDEKPDVILSYRNWKKVPFSHKVANFIWRKTFNFFFKSNFKDTNCGYFAISKDFAKKFKIVGKGYQIENSLLMEIVKKKIKYSEVNVNVKYFEKSGFLRGTKIFFNLWTFIIREGIKHRWGGIFSRGGK